MMRALFRNSSSFSLASLSCFLNRLCSFSSARSFCYFDSVMTSSISFCSMSMRWRQDSLSSSSSIISSGTIPFSRSSFKMSLFAILCGSKFISLNICISMICSFIWWSIDWLMKICSFSSWGNICLASCWLEVLSFFLPPFFWLREAPDRGEAAKDDSSLLWFLLFLNRFLEVFFFGYLISFLISSFSLMSISLLFLVVDRLLLFDLVTMIVSEVMWSFLIPLSLSYEE